jgi:MFS family permease
LKITLPAEALDQAADRRQQQTFPRDCVRGAAHGIIETGLQTFALLVAVRIFDAAPSAKALIVAAGSFGLLLTPLSVFAIAGWQVRAAKACTLLFLAVSLGLLAAAGVASQWAFVAAIIAAAVVHSQQSPLLVHVYNENYPPARRGQLLSRAIVFSVLTAAAFGFLGGRLLDRDLGTYRWLFVAMAVAALISARAISGMPSRPLEPAGSRNPLQHLAYAWSDRVFGGILVVWMLMGLGNLVILPLRVEYMANPQFGVNATNAQIALATAVVPSVVRVFTTHLWGWIFDRFNFFVVRAILNGCFLVGILIFFHAQSLWLLYIASGIFGLALAGGNIAWSLWVTKFAPPGLVPAYMSVHTFFTGVRGIAAPFIGFYLIFAFSAGSVAWISAGLIALSMVLLAPVSGRASRLAAERSRVGQPSP